MPPSIPLQARLRKEQAEQEQRAAACEVREELIMTIENIQQKADDLVEALFQGYMEFKSSEQSSATTLLQFASEVGKIRAWLEREKPKEPAPEEIVANRP